MDPEIAGILLAELAAGTRESMDLTGMADRASVQALTVIQNNLIQQHGGVGDDPGLIAALQTASRVPNGPGGNAAA
jgi:hypothetical protein